MEISTEQFLAQVEQCLGGGSLPGELARDEAARTTHAVLSALALRLSIDDRRRLAKELPRELEAELTELEFAVEGEPSTADTIGRVAAELELDDETAARRVCCVIGAVRHAISRETWEALPSDFEALG